MIQGVVKKIIIIASAFFLIFVITILIVSAYPVIAATRVVTFDEYPAGTILTNEYEMSYFTVFPNGVEVADDPYSTLGNKVARPLLSGEFDRQNLIANFTASPHTVSLQVKEDIGPSGDEVVITMNAWATIELIDRFGRVFRTTAIVDSDRVTFTGGDRTLATLSTSYTPGIEWIEVRMTRNGLVSNLYLLADWLRIDFDTVPSPPPADTTPPTVYISGPSSVTSSTVNYRLRVVDDYRIANIHSTLTHIETGTTEEADICGTAASGICPETLLDRYISLSLADEGDYSLTVTACDTSFNCGEASWIFTLSLPAPPAEVIPWKLELNQGVQTRLSDISGIRPGSFGSASFSQPLVPGKDTAVRWYLLGVGGDNPDFTARMEVYIEYMDSTNRTFSIDPNTGTSSIFVSQDPGVESDRTDLLQGILRPDLSRTLNFVIPGSDLAYADYIQLRLQSVSGTIRVGLNIPTVLGVNLFRVVNRSGLTGTTPTDTQIDTIILPYMKAASPVSEVRELSRRNYLWDETSSSDICGDLLSDFWWDFGGDDTPGRFRYEEGYYSTNIAVASMLGGGCLGIGDIGDPSDGDYRYGNTLVTTINADSATHELGHNIGLRHVGGAHGEAGAEPWPYPHGSVGPDDYGLIPIISSPPSPYDRGLWTLNLIDPCKNATAPDLSDRYPSCSVDSDGDGAADDNQNTHELMSYGAGPAQVPWPTSVNRNRWPSNITYNRFYSAILSGVIPYSSGGPASEITASDADANINAVNNMSGAERVDALMIAGYFQDDNSLKLKPLMRKLVPYGMINNKSTGRYRLILLGEADEIIGEHLFDTTLTGDGDRMIRLLVPFVEGIKRFLIYDGNTTIADQTASPNAPFVRVLKPNGGEILSSGIQTVKWEGGDADGDEVTCQIQYSPDGGVKWQGMGHVKGNGEKEISFDVNELIPGRKGLFRVTATDGINIRYDESDRAFSMATNELPIGFSKLLLEGPENVEIAKSETTRYRFKISYADPEQDGPVRIMDTVPAEFDITGIEASIGNVSYFKAWDDKTSKESGANKIIWDLSAEENEGYLIVEIETVKSPGRGHTATTYKPLSCGPLTLNNGAVAYKVDPANGKIIEPVMEPTNKLQVMAIEGDKPCN